MFSVPIPPRLCARAFFLVSVAVLALPSGVSAQTAAPLPAVTVDAPRQRAATLRKPPRRAALKRDRSRPAVPVLTARQAPPSDSAEARGVPGGGVPPIKQKYQLPQTAESITAREIQEQVNVVDTEDAVKYLPSLFVRKRNNGDTQPVLATRTAGVGASARSLVYADDILLSALIANNNTIGAPRWGLVAPEEIQRVDFLYGPFSAAYPGNSLGGVLLITTRMPDKLELTAKQTEAFQTFDRYKTKGTFRTDQTSVSLGDKTGDVAYLISGNFQNSYSQPLTWVTNTTIPAGTTGAIPQLNKLGTPANVVGAGGLLHTEMGNVKGKVAWDITPTIKATLTTGLWSNEATSDVQTYLRNAAGTPTFGGVAGFASSYYTLSQKHLANAVSVKSDSRGVFDFDLAVSRYDYLQDIQRNPYGVVAGTAGFTTNGRITRLDGTNWTNGDAKGIWRPSDWHEVSFGAHADSYILNNPTYATPTWYGGPESTANLYSYNRGETRTQALWLQDAWTITPGAKLTLGGRWERWQALNGYNLATVQTATGGITATRITDQPEVNASGFSPKASLSVTPAPQWEVTGSIGKAIRFPTVSELYQSIIVGSQVIVPNPNLRPEDGLSEEIAIERKFIDGKVRLSFFNETIRDALISQTTISGNTLVTAVSNVDAVRNRGVELAVRKDNVVIDRLEVFGSITYVDSRILADANFVSTTGTTAVGKRVPNIPDLRATLGATYRPTANWALTVAARYSGKQYSTLDNTDVIPNVFGAFDRFTVVDLRAQYRLTDQATIDVGVDNVGDQKYTLFHPFPGRTYIADARIKF